jgi:hypothetical protein
VQYLQLHARPDLPHPIISHLDSINDDLEMVILVLQGISGGHSGVSVEGISRQWNRLLVDALLAIVDRLSSFVFRSELLPISVVLE